MVTNEALRWRVVLVVQERKGRGGAKWNVYVVGSGLRQGDAPKIVCTPYIKGLSEKIEKVCAPLGVKSVFRPMMTLKRDLMQVKNRTPEQKQTGVVYEIPCKDCPPAYVGETKRTLKFTLSEHRQAVRRGDPKEWHCSSCSKPLHQLGWCHSPRTVEAIHIRKSIPNINNFDSGLLLPMVCLPEDEFYFVSHCFLWVCGTHMHLGCDTAF